MAFFTACELKEAGYTFPELIAADFSRDELVEAGFAEDLNKATALVKIARINGDIVVEDFVISPEESCAELLKRIASLIGTCSCKFEIVAGARIVRRWSPRWLGDIPSGTVVYLRFVDLEDERDRGKKAAEFYRDGICIRCMKEVGISAKEIIESKIPVDAARFKEAGFSLKELVCCFEDRHSHSLRRLLPGGECTLFDSQLKDAGFSAVDFRDAGYHASELSLRFFYNNNEPRDWVLEEIYAFFTADELKEAGYTFRELVDAAFTRNELVEAGFGEDLNKRRRYI